MLGPRPIVYPLHHIVFLKVKNDLQFHSNFSIQIATQCVELKCSICTNYIFFFFLYFTDCSFSVSLSRSFSSPRPNSIGVPEGSVPAPLSLSHQTLYLGDPPSLVSLSAIPNIYFIPDLSLEPRLTQLTSSIQHLRDRTPDPLLLTCSIYSNPIS